MNSLFDPLGFLTPVIVEAKLIYRRLCELELEWDELLPQTELDRWERWIESLNLLKEVSIPRCWFKIRYSSLKLSVTLFCRCFQGSIWCSLLFTNY